MFQFDDHKLLTGYVSAFPKNSPRPDQAAAAGRLMGFISTDPEVTDIRWAAYMLATVKLECANTWAPIFERGSMSYFDKYDADTPLGHRLGNTVDGDGFLYRGRGYVQITGRANYARLMQALKLGPEADLVLDPEQTLRPAIAYRIMSVGMRKGLFTGKKLSDYIGPGGCDYRNARRIINGVDQAQRIAQYATTIEDILRGALVR